MGVKVLWWALFGIINRNGPSIFPWLQYVFYRAHSYRINITYTLSSLSKACVRLKAFSRLKQLAHLLEAPSVLCSPYFFLLQTAIKRRVVGASICLPSFQRDEFSPAVPCRTCDYLRSRNDDVICYCALCVDDLYHIFMHIMTQHRHKLLSRGYSKAASVV